MDRRRAPVEPRFRSNKKLLLPGGGPQNESSKPPQISLKSLRGNKTMIDPLQADRHHFA
jgi:hypothetical protein